MKRLKSCILISIMTLVVCFAITAQGTEKVSVRENLRSDYGSCEEHLYPDDYIVVKAADCSSEGLKYRACIICGNKDTVVIPKNPDNHSGLTSTWYYDPEPNCANGGVKFKICGDCYEQADVTELPPDPDKHIADGDYVVLREATCSEEGEKAHRCKYCGKYFDNQSIPINPRNHITSDNSKWVVTLMPTCSEEGSMDCYCDICGKIAQTKSIPATGKHELEDFYTVDVPASCVSDGSQSRHCAICDAKFDVESIPATPNVHTFVDEFTVDVEPTCTTEGVKSRHCFFCDEVTDVTAVPINPKNHAYNDEWIVTKDATCSEMGLMHQECIYCHEPSLSTVIPKTEHKYGDYEIVKKSADGLSAQVKYVCEVCGHEYITVITLGDNNGGNSDIGDKTDPEILKIIPIENTFYKVDYETLVITNIARNTTLSAFSNNFTNSSSFVMYDTDGDIVDEKSFVGTGFRYNFAPIDKEPTNYKLCVPGDIDSDGKITAADARLILRCAAKLEILENEFYTAADVDLDGKITASDARKTLRVAASIEYLDYTMK